MNIDQYLSAQKLRVDTFLKTYLLQEKDCPQRLREAMAYSLEAGGKRIRPILVIAAGQAVGGALEPVLPIACALEMIHTFSLIHDDLPSMDNDDLRRGKPTNHKIFGEGLAILAGDGLLSEAFRLLCHLDTRSQVEPDVLLDVIRDIALATGPSGMVGGQVLDMQGQGIELSRNDLEKVHRYKTGRLITVALTSGAKISGALPSQLESLQLYGEKVGLAFQVTDDILNVEGSREEMGKSVGSDQCHHKATYPGILGLESSKKLAKELMNQAIRALKDFDESAEPLRDLAEYIVLRRS